MIARRLSRVIAVIISPVVCLAQLIHSEQDAATKRAMNGSYAASRDAPDLSAIWLTSFGATVASVIAKACPRECVTIGDSNAVSLTCVRMRRAKDR